MNKLQERKSRNIGNKCRKSKTKRKNHELQSRVQNQKNRFANPERKILIQGIEKTENEDKQNVK